MWTKDSRNLEILDGDTVTWNDPPHLGGTLKTGIVIGRRKGGWFEVRREDGEIELEKAGALTVQFGAPTIEVVLRSNQP